MEEGIKVELELPKTKNMKTKGKGFFFLVAETHVSVSLEIRVCQKWSFLEQIREGFLSSVQAKDRRRRACLSPLTPLDFIRQPFYVQF